jgi:hypothetical protein
MIILSSVKVRRRAAPVQAAPLTDVRVHDQLHPQVEAPAGEVHDEQRTRELYNTSGNGNRLILQQTVRQLDLRPVLWIRNAFSGSRIRIFPSRIQCQIDPGSASKN